MLFLCESLAERAAWARLKDADAFALNLVCRGYAIPAPFARQAGLLLVLR